SLLGKGGLNNKTFKHLAGYYRFFKEQREGHSGGTPETPSSYLSL
ncbi:unnamed protein product, partial [marine sediment metagenome]